MYKDNIFAKEIEQQKLDDLKNHPQQNSITADAIKIREIKVKKRC